MGSIFISFGISAGRTLDFLVSLFNALHKLPMTFSWCRRGDFAALLAAVTLV